MGLSPMHILLVIIVILLFFGAGRVPEIMENLAKGVKSFKQGLKDDDDKSAKKIDKKDTLN
jgi:sec-independent protein translocase protein TatA